MVEQGIAWLGQCSRVTRSGRSDSGGGQKPEMIERGPVRRDSRLGDEEMGLEIFERKWKLYYLTSQLPIDYAVI